MKTIEKNVQLNGRQTKNSEKRKSLVIFIIGPYAAKWFANLQTENAARFDNEIVWILTPTANSLNDSLIKINEKYKNVIIKALFPFLPDGHENIHAMISSIMSWKLTLASMSLIKPIPCIFTIYARFSEERLSHDPDRAVWIGNLDISTSHPTSIDDEFNKINNELKNHEIGTDKYITQRHIMIDALFTWMDETTLKRNFQDLFSISPFYLSSVILADHSNGFIRHGAWAQWIAEKYEILPGLSSAITLPPLPPLKYISAHAYFNTPIASKKKFGWIWVTTAATLLLTISIIAASLHETRTIKTITTHINNFNEVNNINIREKQNAFNTLIEDKKYLLSCIKKNKVLGWWLSRCDQLFLRVNNSIEKYNDSEKYMISGSLSFFKSGSSELVPENDKELTSILPIINNNKGMRFLIIGHSDNTGSSEVNKKLSEKRAKAIQKWITEHSDIPKNNLIVQGAGDSHPIASNETIEGREKNRRFDIIPLPSEAKY
ncbi:OmpA family protein [Rouxiella sp. Mn2063]|uniref:OmpA family protein n=1 Tax=Rouxiella sp. Mn2063 TaxID=3395262 RepID=UPI003BD72AF5